jgi:hypothetical protein
MADLRKDGWFGQLVISGVGQPNAHRGSIMGIVGESLKDIGSQRMRVDANGDSEIVIRIRNKPFDTSKESALYMDKSIEVDALLDTSTDSDKPIAGESYGDFFDRLITNGYPVASATMIASDWFELAVDEKTLGWLHDPKAIRFRELNSRTEAFDSALPAEYEALKNYVTRQYPFFCEHLTFRTA